MIGFKNFIQNCKKIILFIVIICSILLLFYFFSTKQTRRSDNSSVIENNREQIRLLVADKKLNSTQEGRTVLFAYRSISCIAIGEACIQNPSNHAENFNNSAFGFMSSLLSFPTSNPPASGVYWVRSQLESTGFVPKSYAAEGVGFAAIKGYQSLWIIFRNIAYITLVLVITVIGFMIMFKIKINPQTVVTLENALPRIIITLVLITFSFAIAGFLIDLMYLIIAVVISQLTSLGVAGYSPSDAVKLIDKYSSASIGDVFNPTDNIIKIGGSFLSILPMFVQQLIGGFFSFVGTVLFVKLLKSETLDKAVGWLQGVGGIAGGGFIASVIGGVQAGNIVQLPVFIITLGLISILWPIIGPLIIGILIFFTILFLVMRIFFLLLKTYISILLQVIFSPLILLLHAIPGRNAFSKWFKSLFVNIMIFPLVVILILTANILGIINVENTSAWQPPFLYGASVESFSTLIALGMLLLIPDIVKAFKASVGIKESPIKFGLGTFFGGVTGVGGGAFEQMSKFGGVGHAMSMFQGNGALAKFNPFGKKKNS